VFRPHQIKSATGNRGTYDTTKADINKAEGGPVPPLRPNFDALRAPALAQAALLDQYKQATAGMYTHQMPTFAQWLATQGKAKGGAVRRFDIGGSVDPMGNYSDAGNNEVLDTLATPQRTDFTSVMDRYPAYGSAAWQRKMEQEQAIKPDTTLEELAFSLPRAGLAAAKGLATRAAPASKYHPTVQKAIDEGRMPESMGEFMTGYVRAKGNPEIGTGGYGSDGASEKMANYLKNMRSGEQAVPKGYSLTGASKGYKAPPRKAEPVNYSVEELRNLPIDESLFKKGGSIKPIGYTKEKVTVAPDLNAMKYEMMSVKHFTKKAK